MPRPHNRRLGFASGSASESQTADSYLRHGTSSGTRVSETQLSDHVSGTQLHGDDGMHLTDIDEDEVADDGNRVATQGSQLPRLELLGSNKLWPQNTSNTVGNIIRRKVAPEAYTWKKVPEQLKLEHFNEMKKHYTIPENEKEVLYKRFLMVASDCYKESVHNWKVNRDEEKPEGIDDCAWPDWLAYWNSEPVKEKAKKASDNRKTEVDGPGSGIAKYWHGSKSTAAMQREAEKGEDMGLFDVFCVGRKGSQGGWKDTKSRKIGEAVEKELIKRNEDLTTEEVDEIFLKANPPSKKRCLYGTGSAGLGTARAGSIRKTGVSSTSSEDYRRDVQK